MVCTLWLHYAGTSRDCCVSLEIILLLRSNAVPHSLRTVASTIDMAAAYDADCVLSSAGTPGSRNVLVTPGSRLQGPPPPATSGQGLSVAMYLSTRPIQQQPTHTWEVSTQRTNRYRAAAQHTYPVCHCLKAWGRLHRWVLCSWVTEDHGYALLQNSAGHCV